MTHKYEEALAILHATAREIRQSSSSKFETTLINLALGRVAHQDVYSAVQTPTADTSAMDGYAVASLSTSEASLTRPMLLTVKGILAAGAAEIQQSDKYESCNTTESNCIVGDTASAPCIEIMTGARFPKPTEHNGRLWELDACIRKEDVQIVCSDCPNHGQLIQITRPAKHNQNRRLAGEDFAQGDLVIRKGQIIQPQHVMALASLGIRYVNVLRKIKIAIASTGDEVVPTGTVAEEFQLSDANGPFLYTMLQDPNVELVHLGTLKDSIDSFRKDIGKSLTEQHFDMIITTGGVSCGRFDFVKEGLIQIGGKVKFHHVAVRPGHPILFGVASVSSHHCAFFGLPGNPMACVACFRFFVMPYLRDLHGLPEEKPRPCQILSLPPNRVYHEGNEQQSNGVLTPPSQFYSFRLGKREPDSQCKMVVLLHNAGSHRIKPLLEADCWVIVPPSNTGHTVGDALDTVPLHASLSQSV